MKCESCKGTGRIEMFLSVVDCLDCQRVICSGNVPVCEPAIGVGTVVSTPWGQGVIAYVDWATAGAIVDIGGGSAVCMTFESIYDAQRKGSI